MTGYEFAAQVQGYAEQTAALNGTSLTDKQSESIRRACVDAFYAHDYKRSAGMVDGLGCVEWVKKYREEFGVGLREAKAAWDLKVAA